MDEPTVLDYVKALLTPWRGTPPPLWPAGQEAQPATAPEVQGKPEEQRAPEKKVVAFAASGVLAAVAPDTDTTLPAIPQTEVPFTSQTAPPPEPIPETQGAPFRPVWPWRSLIALGLALIAQRSLEPGPESTWVTGVLFYLLAAIWLVWANQHKEWLAAPLPAPERNIDPLTIRMRPLLFGIPLAVLSFLAFGGNQFNSFNVLLWLFTLGGVIYAFWLPNPNAVNLFQRGRKFLSNRRLPWRVSFTGWTLLVLAVAVLIIFFRVYRINQVPIEMTSDHAEKLLDVWDVLHGQTRIFFPRNTGREAIQFYLTAEIIRLLGTGISFLSLKIGTVLAGLLTLPFLYLLGKETGNREVGLLATLFAGIAYWPNVISRMGLRFPFYPLFVAPTLYFLLRGIRRSNRNDFILAGLFLGIGLHGYTPIRILPLVIVVAVGIYLLHPQARGLRRQTLFQLLVLALVALVVFLPLVRFATQYPESFSVRAFSRLTPTERPLPGPAWQIFLQNLWRAVTMFAWDNGEIWTVSVTHRPALDVVSGALFTLGVVLLLVRYVRHRNWLDLFLLLAVPLLMLPSILSLAFPSENPALNRAGAAFIPVFLIVGIAAEGLLQALRNGLGARNGTRLAWAVAIVLVTWSALQNYDLVFNQYAQQYTLASWNTSEMGQMIEDFSKTMGNPESAWVVPYPYWVDTRLVGINAGQPTRDYAIQPDQLAGTVAVPTAKLFIINLQDQASQTQLKQLYPQGWLKQYSSKQPDKDFLMFFVPPSQ